MIRPRWHVRTLATSALAVTEAVSILAVKVVEWACYACAIAALGFLSFVELHTGFYEHIHDTPGPIGLQAELAEIRTVTLIAASGVFAFGLAVRMFVSPPAFIDRLYSANLRRMLRRGTPTDATH